MEESKFFKNQVIQYRGGGTGGAQGARAPPVFWEKEQKDPQ